MNAESRIAPPFSDDAHVVLDPAVEILEDQIAGYRLLCHTGIAVGMAVPPGDGLLAFVSSLMGQPVRVGACRAQFDNAKLIDQMLASLCQHGFAHLTSNAAPSAADLSAYRAAAAARRAKRLRNCIVIDLDAAGAVDQLVSKAAALEAAPEVSLRCARLADHGTVLAELASLRQTGKLRMHHTIVQTRDLRCASQTRRALIRLGASVTLEAVAWPAPAHPVAGLADMTGDSIAVHALMAPDLSILDETVRDRALAWAAKAFISGLCLELDADTLWRGADVADDAFVRLFSAVRALEYACGDVQVVNLPGDEVLLGNTAASAPIAPLSDVAHRMRLAYLRWRIPFLKSCEGSNAWSQTPEVEEKLVRSQDDLLPNHPELLGLRAGSYLVDVCGGLGRVARRLAPAVGPDGLVISIEMLRLLSERARHFACERNITNLQFRPGLAQRIALPDQSVDAAVNEWTGAIWELGIGPAMVKEMVRIVRPGGRIALTHRLVQMPLAALDQPWIQYKDIYRWMREAVVHPELTIITERVWGQMVPSLVGDSASLWHKQYMPRLVDPYDHVYEYDSTPGARADVYLTIVAQRRC
jgi:SAM-dependent methyltransferase